MVTMKSTKYLWARNCSALSKGNSMWKTYSPAVLKNRSRELPLFLNSNCWLSCRSRSRIPEFR